ncbi:MAG TPA: hypothetical protein VJN18_10540 [Polyangiaceae bacterium]|nr:hypothetical protein [Polyangiaceae bacterium]
MVHRRSRVLGLSLAACAAAVWLLQAEVGRSQPSGVVELAARKAKDGPEITFSGYQALADGRGILFVEMTESVAVEVKRAAQVIEYKLVGARVPLRNNKNPLLLRDFSSSAVSAVLVADKKSVRLVVTLRANVNPTHRMIQRGKAAVLEIELPAPPAR